MTIAQRVRRGKSAAAKIVVTDFPGISQKSIRRAARSSRRKRNAPD
jgi:hypothetical protein